MKTRIIRIVAVLAILTGIAHLLNPSESYLRSRVVTLTGHMGLCSGEQVRAPSGKDYILTAAHCRKLESNGSMVVTTEDGRQLERRVIAEDDMSDLLLLEGIPNMRGLDIAKYALLGNHIRTFTHGARHSTYKTEGEILENAILQIPLEVVETEQDAIECTKVKNVLADMQSWFGPVKVCFLVVEETFTQAMIVPGSSGGMVVNDDGELVGVVSAGDGKFGALVTLHHIKSFLHNY